MSTVVAEPSGFPAARRRTLSIVVLGLAVVALLAAVALYFLQGSAPTTTYWAIFGVLVLVLVLELVLFLLPAGKAQAHASAPMAASMADATPAPAAPIEEPKVLSLRCGDCGTVFDITDTGARPLYHTCPGCGAEGVLNAPVEAPAAPPMHDFAAPASDAKPVKRLKLRCGGCKEIFTIEDTGERPLRRPCPYCSRMGEVK